MGTEMSHSYGYLIIFTVAALRTRLAQHLAAKKNLTTGHKSFHLTGSQLTLFHLISSSHPGHVKTFNPYS